MENSTTVNQILDQYTRVCVPKLAPRTQKDYVRHIAILRHHFGERDAPSLVPKDFRDFMEVSKGRIHRNRTVAVLSAAFTFAVRRLYVLDRNIIRDVARHESEPRDRYVTDEEFHSLRALMPARLQIAMDLALLTGQRQGDLLSLKWTQVQPIGIVFKQAKTGKRLAVDITPALQAVLDRAKAIYEGSEYVICTEQGRRYTSEGFRAMWQRYVKKWVARGNARATFHDLRAKSASDSNTIDDAYQRLGHTSIAMTRRAYDRGIRKVQPLR
jgi:integrase